MFVVSVGYKMSRIIGGWEHGRLKRQGRGKEPELISKHYGCSDGIKNKIGNLDGGKWKVGVCCG